MKQPLILTGGRGFLGLHLVRAFLEDGRFHPVVVDLAESGKSEFPEGVDFYQGDIRDEGFMATVFQEVAPKVLVHAAAQLPRAEPSEIQSTTVGGTRLLLNLAESHGVERTVFLSSTAVYGTHPSGPYREDDTELIGFGPYGRAKVDAEKLCEEARSRGQIVSIIRPKSFLGPGRMGVFQLLFDWILEGRRIPMMGSGDNAFQLLDVRDLCSAVLMLLGMETVSANRTYNIGATDYGSVRTDLEGLCAHAGTKARPISIPVAPANGVLSLLYALNLSPIYPWVFRTAALDSEVDVDRILGLGWRAEYSNIRCLIDAFDWYRTEGKGSRSGPRTTGHRSPWEHGAIKVIRHFF